MRSLWLLLCFALGVSGCLPLRYLPQAVAGQVDMLDRRQPLDEVLRSERIPPRTRSLLASVPSIKAFGRAHGLRATRSYESYANLSRFAAVWVVSASDPLSFDAKSWHFPIVGSITYLGWFSRDRAEGFARELREQGWDVDVRPASAYSTLGWFDDPVLSTMIADGDEALGELANVILHESLHATFFVPGQSTLNESVAAFVGDRLAQAYLDRHVGVDAPATLAYRASEARQTRRAQLMQTAYRDLETLYASDGSVSRKQLDKSSILTKLRADLDTTRRLGNASLLQYKTYGSGQKELAVLLAACGNSWPRLLRNLQKAKDGWRDAQEHEDPARLLAPLLGRACVP